MGAAAHKPASPGARRVSDSGERAGTAPAAGVAEVGVPVFGLAVPALARTGWR
jgi:hypothetical protein